MIRCRDDCAGLCPQCGADRNVVACGCEPPKDARWERLRELSVAAPRLVRYASAQYARPEEEDLEVPPRQASLPGRAQRDRRRRLRAVRIARRRSHRMCPTCKTYKGREIEPLGA